MLRVVCSLNERTKFLGSDVGMFRCAQLVWCAFHKAFIPFVENGGLNAQGGIRPVIRVIREQAFHGLDASVTSSLHASPIPLLTSRHSKLSRNSPMTLKKRSAACRARSRSLFRSG